MKKINNNQSILYGVIFILLIAIIYLGYEKFSNNQLSKAIKNVQCTAPSKICVLTTHKYTDKLEVQLEILPGKDYYKDDKLKSYEKYLSDWEKDKKNRDMFDSSLVIKNFVESHNGFTVFKFTSHFFNIIFLLFFVHHNYIDLPNLTLYETPIVDVANTLRIKSPFRVLFDFSFSRASKIAL